MAYENKKKRIVVIRMVFSDLIYETLKKEDIGEYQLNFFSQLTNDCLTIDMGKCNIDMGTDTLILESKDTDGYSLIDLTKVVMVEFVKKG